MVKKIYGVHAAEAWNSLGRDVKQNILTKAKCPQCGSKTDISDSYEIRLKRKTLRIKGFCSECGAEIEKTIEK